MNIKERIIYVPIEPVKSKKTYQTVNLTNIFKHSSTLLTFAALKPFNETARPIIKKKRQQM